MLKQTLRVIIFIVMSPGVGAYLILYTIGALVAFALSGKWNYDPLVLFRERRPRRRGKLEEDLEVNKGKYTIKLKGLLCTILEYDKDFNLKAHLPDTDRTILAEVFGDTKIQAMAEACLQALLEQERLPL